MNEGIDNEFPDVMTMNKRKLMMESSMLNYIEIIPGNSIVLISYQILNMQFLSVFIGQLVFVTFKRDLKPISNKYRTYIRVDNFLHYEGEHKSSAKLIQ